MGTCPWNRTMALRLTMALLDRSWSRTRTSTSARKRTPEKWNQDKTSIVVVDGGACVILQAAVRGNFHRAWTKSSERSRTRKSWNQDKTSIALVARHVDFRLQRPLAGARGVWRTRTWSRNRTTSLRSWNRTRTRLSDRTRTRTSWNQDKTSIAKSTSAPPGAGGARGAVGGAEAARSAGGARGVLEWKTRAWTRNRTL